MGRVLIENDCLRAEIDPELGAGVADFSLRGPDGVWTPLMRRAAAGVSHFNDLASYTLAPWSNRIAGATFAFAGRGVALHSDWTDGTAIHGAVKDKPWQIVQRSPVSATLEFESRGAANVNWPWEFSCGVRYALSGPGFETRAWVENRAVSEMPCGIGFHPYWMRRLWNERDEVVVRADVAGRYPCTDMLPRGPARPDDVTAALARGELPHDLDDIFAWPSRRARIEWPASGVTLDFECSENLSHMVVYSPAARPWFCVEPVSMVNDGFNLASRGETGTGVVTLRPGARMEVVFGVRLTVR